MKAFFGLAGCLLLSCSGPTDPRTAPANGTQPADPRDCTAPSGPFQPDPEPTARLGPVPGELYILQRRLPVGLHAEPGESSIIVGPDGTLVLLDVGNGHHDDDIRALVRELNTTWLVPARGYPARSPLQVEWVVLTHFHADHVGAFGPLTSGDEPLDIRKGVIHRGLVDLGEAASESSVPEVCTFLRAHPKLDVPMCASALEAPCTDAAFSAHHPATACPGLHLGDLEDPADDARGAPTRISLGNCAKLVILGGDAHLSAADGERTVDGIGFTESNEENARSLVGYVEHGEFRYHFGGDLTGSGETGVPDVETAFAQVGREHHGARGVDVVHVHHHARRTSSNDALVGALAPNDGRSRNVVAGINAAYVGSPHAEVVEAWTGGGRLGNGSFWITASAGGAKGAGVVEADGDVVVRTFLRGRGYRVQAVGDVTTTKAFPSVREMP